MNIFSDYTTYLKDNPKRYWFKRKLYGWGWIPARPPGWIATIGYLLAIASIVYMMERGLVNEELGFGLFGGVTIALILLAWLTGEPPRWQWGLPPSGRNE